VLEFVLTKDRSYTALSDLEN